MAFLAPGGRPDVTVRVVAVVQLRALREFAGAATPEDETAWRQVLLMHFGPRAPGPE